MRTDVGYSFVTLLLALGAVGQFLVPVLRSLLRSHVALALEILYLAPLLIVTKLNSLPLQGRSLAFRRVALRTIHISYLSAYV